MSRPENLGHPVSNPEDVMAVDPRKTFMTEIVKLLKKGGQTEKKMWATLDYSPKQWKTFTRAIDDLQKFGVISPEDEEGRVYLIGYGEPENIEFSIGVRPLRVTMPFEKSAAKRLLNKRSVLKHLITRREGLVYEILTGAGLLEKNTRQKEEY
ncbi:unnamed protein product [marine sediment metagenome]|uniref:Uncharacterized protein n=1 Tax=marine sediment metagenome TaxID=412755 RepID=X1C9U2_9ZZZZ